MFNLKVINVNQALPLGLRLLSEHGIKVSPRGMATLEYPEPVATMYTKPWQRVLFNPIRDANPFFHLMESLWILGGRNDVSFPCRFNSKLAEYSDDGKTFHGAYGHRLRSCGKDQLALAINKLSHDPDSRQVVLQIWDSKKDLHMKSNDLPCNDLIFVKIRNGKLNISVANRSNDAIWGAYGANAVQFAFIQEYLSSMIGVEIGTYHQVSDSFHAYTDNPQWKLLTESAVSFEDYYINGKVKVFPLIDEPKTFDIELQEFLDGKRAMFYDNRFFQEVAVPMYDAWYEHKDVKCGADVLNQCNVRIDWIYAGLEWLGRRNDK